MGHLWMTTGGAIQCATHAIERWDYDEEWEFEQALAPLCMKCNACKKCEPNSECSSSRPEGGPVE